MLNINVRENELSEIIINSLTNKTPLFNLRCGDGEMIMMNPSDRVKFEMFSKNYLGYVIDDTTTKEITNNLISCIVFSDIIGLPEEHHKQSSEYWSIIEKKYITIFNQFNIDINSKKYCSINSHIDLLTSYSLDNIIKNTTEIVLITSRDIKDNFKKQYPHLKRIELFLIPGEQKYEINPIKSPFYPQIHHKIKDKIESENRSGQLCLFGTGFAGKDLGLYFSNMGGVAVDIGSVFDIWSGKLTRGKNKGSKSIIDKDHQLFNYVL